MMRRFLLAFPSVPESVLYSKVGSKLPPFRKSVPKKNLTDEIKKALALDFEKVVTPPSLPIKKKGKPLTFGFFEVLEKELEQEKDNPSHDEFDYSFLPK